MASATNISIDPTEAISESLPARERQAILGQFLTPTPVAEFMASLFKKGNRNIKLLDAGAGAGALTAAFVRMACSRPQKPCQISVTAYEIDNAVLASLKQTLQECKTLAAASGVGFSATIENKDFVSSAVSMVREDLFNTVACPFNAAIVNPPYRKISSSSPTRLLLRSVGIETSNIYAGFMELIIRLLSPGGELVAITPRSFCNGPYFKSFRKELLRLMSLRRLHIFDSRSAAFSGDKVLQENLILHAIRSDSNPNFIIISNSSGKHGAEIMQRTVPYKEVVRPEDNEQFIHVLVTPSQTDAKSAIMKMPATLADLGLAVSTGRVVDFRAAQFLRHKAAPDTVPLIYPCHFNGGYIEWPKQKSRKPNAIVLSEETSELLIPSGAYVLLKRFTSKEERKRIVACIFDPVRVTTPLVGFENHLNYFHCTGRGLSMDIAKGLAMYLNSNIVDTYFRQFSGHTQVNATDLRSLSYPSKIMLEKVGKSIDNIDLSQERIDEIVGEMIFGDATNSPGAS